MIKAQSITRFIQRKKLVKKELCNILNIPSHCINLRAGIIYNKYINIIENYLKDNYNYKIF